MCPGGAPYTCGRLLGPEAGVKQGTPGRGVRNERGKVKDRDEGLNETGTNENVKAPRIRINEEPRSL